MYNPSEAAIWRALSEGDISLAIVELTQKFPHTQFRDERHALTWAAVISACPLDGDGTLSNLRVAITHGDTPKMAHRALATIVRLAQGVHDMDAFEISCAVARIRSAAPNTKRIALVSMINNLILINDDVKPQNVDYFWKIMSDITGAPKK